jgi:threonine aldolase
MSTLVDLASDTATRPTPAMRRAIADADVGDEQLREDPTVRRLEEMVADLTGKEDALFLPSGTMCNVIALYVQCRPGDEVIVHRHSHPVYSEGGGPALHSRVSLCMLDGPRGTFTAQQVTEAILPPEPWKARTSLVACENTNHRAGGTVWDPKQIGAVCRAARRAGLRSHLDGARLMNAVVASGVDARRWCAQFGSAWIDFSKGLGCPMGAVLAGERALIEEARRAKHAFGGAMRQAGMMAAAGIHALEHHVDRLADDHALARALAEGLASVPGVELDPPSVETNIVCFRIAGAGLEPAELLARLPAHGVRFSLMAPGLLRGVTHLDVTAEGVRRAIAAVAAAVTGARTP